jgi:hypothetical protein
LSARLLFRGGTFSEFLLFCANPVCRLMHAKKIKTRELLIIADMAVVEACGNTCIAYFIFIGQQHLPIQVAVPIITYLLFLTIIRAKGFESKSL